MFTTIVVGNVVKKSALRQVQVAGKTSPVIDIRIAAPNGGEKVHFVKCVVWGNDALAVSEHLEVGRTVSVEGTPKVSVNRRTAFRSKGGMVLVVLSFRSLSRSSFWPDTMWLPHMAAISSAVHHVKRTSSAV